MTPHLALGGAWRLSADYMHSTETSGVLTGTTNGFTLSLGQVRLTGQLYF
jgi:hypothetical protein